MMFKILIFFFLFLLKIYLVYRLVFFIFMFIKDLFSLQFCLLHPSQDHIGCLILFP